MYYNMYKKILLIDDDADEQFFFMEALKEIKGAVKFFYADNVKEGMQLMNFLLPDFIFLDINMPIQNGLEFLESITHNINKQPGIIIYSTGANDEVCKKALQKGATACIKKSNNINDLAAILKDLLRLDF